MLTFEKDNNVFVYRVAGVAIYDNKLLVHKNVFDDFWSLPGGRCEFLEKSEDALIREMEEELGIDIKIIRPLYFVENFFYFKGKHYHELSIFYQIEYPPNSKLAFEKNIFHGKELDLIFKWVALDDIENLRLYPLFLRKSLKNIKSYPEHIINHDD